MDWQKDALALAQKGIAKEYTEYFDTAKELADKEKTWDKDLVKSYKYGGRLHLHIMRMMEMHESRYGSSEERRLIVDFIEKQIKAWNANVETPTLILPDYVWEEMKKAVLSGNYRNIESEKE